MIGYITGCDREMKPTYDTQVKDGVRDDYLWEFQKGNGKWGVCKNAFGDCEPMWGFGRMYRVSLKNDPLLNEQKEQIRLLEAKLDTIRGDYKKLADDFKGLVTDLAPSLDGDQLRMVDKRTGNWFHIVEQKPSYIIR